MYNPTGRLTETDMEEKYKKSYYALPYNEDGAQEIDGKLEFFEWLNHLGFSRQSYRTLSTEAKEILNEAFDVYVENDDSSTIPNRRFSVSFTEFVTDICGSLHEFDCSGSHYKSRQFYTYVNVLSLKYPERNNPTENKK